MSGCFLSSCYAAPSSYFPPDILHMAPSSLMDLPSGLTTLAGDASPGITVSIRCSSLCPFMPRPHIPWAPGLLHASLRGVASSTKDDSLCRWFAFLDLAQNLARSEFIPRKNEILAHPIFSALYPVANKILCEGKFDNRRSIRRTLRPDLDSCVLGTPPSQIIRGANLGFSRARTVRRRGRIPKLKIFVA